MNIEELDKWLDNEYGCSYTKLEELHNYWFEKSTNQKLEIERLNNIINELEKLELYEFTPDYDYDENLVEGYTPFNIREYIQELKGSNEPSFEEMLGFVENVCKDIKSQSTLHEELEEERKTIAKIVGDFKEVNK